MLFLSVHQASTGNKHIKRSKEDLKKNEIKAVCTGTEQG